MKLLTISACSAEHASQNHFYGVEDPAVEPYYNGAGDVFASVLCGSLLAGMDMQSALEKSAFFVYYILEPTTLLKAISLLPEKAAVMLTAASGALVPIATIVKPIIRLGICRARAKEDVRLRQGGVDRCAFQGWDVG